MCTCVLVLPSVVAQELFFLFVFLFYMSFPLVFFCMLKEKLL